MKTAFALAIAGFIAAQIGVAAAEATLRKRATETLSFYVSPSGDDRNNGCLLETSPCQTPQHAYSQLMNDWDHAGYDPFIRLAPGTYPTGVHMAGQPVGSHTVNVVGQQSEDQSCTLAQAQQVIVQAPPGQAIFDIEDLAIAVVRCLTVEGSGAAAFTCRQTPARDIAYIQFGGSAGLLSGVSAGDGCGINLGGEIWLANDMNYFLAGSISRITIAYNVSIIALNRISIPYFALSTKLNVIDFHPRVKIVNSDFLPESISIVHQGGTISTSGVKLPGEIKQGDPSAPGYVYK